MTDTSYIGISQLRALQRQLDIATNNIANANTSGFKAEFAVFESTPKANVGTGNERISFVSDRGSYLDLAGGTLTQTGNPLDIAVSGEAWLSFNGPDGERAYGRDGGLTLDAEGTLRSSSGAELLDEGGAPIQLPPDLAGIKVSADGTITAEGTGPLARIGLFDIPEIQSYRRLGDGLVAAPEGAAPAQPAEGSRIVQGALEGSNVNAVREMTRLIDIQRAYERGNALLDNDNTLSRDALRRIGQTI